MVEFWVKLWENMAIWQYQVRIGGGFAVLLSLAICVKYVQTFHDLDFVDITSNFRRDLILQISMFKSFLGKNIVNFTAILSARLHPCEV